MQVTAHPGKIAMPGIIFKANQGTGQAGDIKLFQTPSTDTIEVEVSTRTERLPALTVPTQDQAAATHRQQVLAVLAPEPIQFLLYTGFQLPLHQAVIAQGVTAITYRKDIVGTEAGDGEQRSIHITLVGYAPFLTIEVQDGGAVADRENVLGRAAP